MTGRCRRSVSYLACAALAVVLQVLPIDARQGAPRVPPGRDPGGVAVAIVGDGIDYTHPEVAKRLARDGEGEIIGWDFIDNDRRPWERCETASCTTTLALAIVEGAPRARIVAIRAGVERPQSVILAFLMVIQSPARIVVLGPSAKSADARFIEEVGKRYPQLLLIAADEPRAIELGNVVVVSDSNSQHADITAARLAARAASILAAEPALAGC